VWSPQSWRLTFSVPKILEICALILHLMSEEHDPTSLGMLLGVNLEESTLGAWY